MFRSRLERPKLQRSCLFPITSTGSMETSCITFQYRASDTGHVKLCTLTVEKFIHRFLQHVLPQGFVKVRYFGFLAATLRSRLKSLQQLLKPTRLPENDPPPPTSPAPALTNLSSSRFACPKCHQPMIYQRSLLPAACRSP
jgi:hypothetical protein